MPALTLDRATQKQNNYFWMLANPETLRGIRFQVLEKRHVISMRK